MKNWIVLILAVFMENALAAPPNPSGTWNLRWDDRSYGVALYQGDDTANVGDEFVRPSDYHTQESLDGLASIESLSVTYTDGASTATISDAGVTGARTLEVRPLPSGGWQADGREPLGLITLDPVDGCLSRFGVYERIAILESGGLA